MPSDSPPDISRHLPPRERIARRLAYLYGSEQTPEIERRIDRLVKTHRQLRTRIVDGHYWSHDDVVLITYGDSIQSSSLPPLQSLHAFLNEHLDEAFSMVHILPFFPWSSDDGFSVTDFRAVKEDLGSWKDIRKISEDFDLAIDLVLNHCSRENLWFIDFIFGDEPACGYFIELDPKTNTALVTRPRSTPLLSGVRTQSGMRHVWTTFSNDQIDLNYANPDVLIEFIDILLYYVRRGARMLRLDAVAYLWKELGTNCIHLPQTHQVVKLFRDILDLCEPGVLIMTETNVPHAENISYFGDGDEAHVIYQFSLPPLLLHAIHAGDSRYLNAWARDLEALRLPPNCTALNFSASHDGVGLRPLEGLVPKEEVASLLEDMRRRGGYISTKSNTDGSESPYELNISYFDAFRDPDGDNQWHIARFIVSQVLVLSFRGIPAVYIHCLTATPNDKLGVERTGMTRSVNRRKWDRGELDYLVSDLSSETGQVFTLYTRLLAQRRAQIALHPDAAQHIIDVDDRVFCFERVALDDSQHLLVLANVSADEIVLSRTQLPHDIEEREELLGLNDVRFDDHRLCLAPYAVFWFSLQT
ncbi:MAG: alpha-amylase [Gammaproteobacteria bacterium]|nr:alpha-amylase [Gammaproteobacteria bacterium]